MRDSRIQDRDQTDRQQKRRIAPSPADSRKEERPRAVSLFAWGFLKRFQKRRRSETLERRKGGRPPRWGAACRFMQWKKCIIDRETSRKEKKAGAGRAAQLTRRERRPPRWRSEPAADTLEERTRRRSAGATYPTPVGTSGPGRGPQGSAHPAAQN